MKKISAHELIQADEILADRARVAIMATLAASDAPLPFMRLLELLQMTKGNLSSHLRKLEEADYVVFSKSFQERKPLTTYQCTEKGRGALSKYLATLEGFIRAHRS